MSIKFSTAIGGFTLCIGLSWTPCLSYASCPNCTCTVAVTPVNFGDAYNPLNGNIDQSLGTLTVMCTSLTAMSNASFSIALNSGLNSSFNSRVLESGNHFLNYNLYTDGSFTQIWGDGSSGTNIVTFNNCTSSEQSAPYSCSHTFTLYGKIPASQIKIAGQLAYVNTLIATLNY